MYEMIFYMILICIIIYIAYCLVRNIVSAINSKTRSTTQTQEYIRKKVALENKHCSKLPFFDSKGRATSYGNSWNEKTGKFSPELADKLRKLNEEYNIPINHKKKRE